MARHSLVYITAPDPEEAARIGRMLVEKRLAGCVNVVPTIRSFYRWEGELQEDSEALLFVKTRRELVPEVVAAVKATHPYQVPAVLAVDVVEGNEDYLRWLDSECGHPGGGC